MSRKEIRQQFEEWGEPKVKQMLKDGHSFFGQADSPYQTEVLLWLAEIVQARQEAREEETLSIAREANSIARSASFAATAAAVSASDANKIARFNRKISIAATVIAAIATVIAIFKE